ncbi:MAG: sigma-54-dependent Fis family transcriptional regulator [Acidobacteria bacterium]|nr:sigma-54-dependent Fis family transcriptional regulator [Acidobacteriota bacterium]
MTPRPRNVLIVARDESMRNRIAVALRPDFRSTHAVSGEAALPLMQHEQVDVALVDVDLGGISGLELLRIIRENFNLTEVLMISAIRDVDVIVQAIKGGAFHYITEDFSPEGLRSLVRHACERQELNRQVLALSAQVADQTELDFVVGNSQPMKDIVDLVHKVAKLSATVLVLGESGTGKELIARLLHRESERSEGPFIPVNLAAIPSELVESTLFGHERGAFTGAARQQLGKFELAAGGTLFLDEIGDLRLDLQAKLLRAIQEEEIERVGGAKPIRTDFRLIVATNTDLQKAVKDGRFREDLFFRINVIPMKIPPLRERLEDVPVLARFFFEHFKAKYHRPVEGIAESTLRVLSTYWWPGNVRELQNLIERLVAVSDKDWITDDDLPLEYHFAKLDTNKRAANITLFQEACDTFERNYIIRALERNDWNVTATAKYLGLPLSTLKFKMGKLEIRELARKIRGG